MRTQTKDLKAELKQFTGTTQFFRIPMIRTNYTDGIKYLAEKADCFWLVTDTSIMAKSLARKNPFITIDFKRYDKVQQTEKSKEAVITYSNGNGKQLMQQEYYVTDFPLDELRLFFLDNTLCLPSEY